MSVKAAIVVFEEDVSEENFERVAELFRMVRGVVAVKPQPVGSMEYMLAMSRAKYELKDKLIDIVRDKD